MLNTTDSMFVSLLRQSPYAIVVQDAIGFAFNGTSFDSLDEARGCFADTVAALVAGIANGNSGGIAELRRGFLGDPSTGHSMARLDIRGI